MKAYAIINFVDDGYEVKIGPRTRKPEVYKDFKLAYEAGCRHTGWNYDYVFINVQPAEYQDVMNEVQCRRNKMEQSALKSQEIRELKRLQEKYPNEQ
jgi:hypothetical protein